MLLQPPSLSGWGKHPCARCGTELEGLAPGAQCPACRQELTRRAARIARWVAMGTTAVLAVYVILRVPAEPSARLVGAIGVLIWYVLTARIAARIAREWLK